MQANELERLLRDEIVQRKEEGYDVSEIEESYQKAEKKALPELEEYLVALQKSLPRSDFPYCEPSELPKIKAERPKEPEKVEITVSDDELYDKIYGGWLGRCAGCLLGKPVEGLKKEQIEEWLRTAEKYPLRDYFPTLPELREDAPEWLKRRSARSAVLSGHISRMARDDDTDYTVLGLHVLENHGLDFTTKNIGGSWLSLLPYWRVYTAERVAYRNLVNGLEPPETATYLNPYREWIGAQIRADMWGYVTPGMPAQGAELAYRDGCLSHVKNGIYGEMLAGAMISAAFTTDDVEEVIETGLSVIPEKSRLAESVRDTVAWSRESDDWKRTWNKISEKYGHYHPVHTINNAAIVLMGLIHGKGDYGRSIAISVMGGLDTDCNGATAGSILGVMLGAKALPEKWISPLNDRIESFVTGYNNSQISDLAERTFNMAKKALST